MRIVSSIAAGLGLAMLAGAAHAEIESIHRTSFRNPGGFCQGDHRAYMPSRFADAATGFDLIGPGTIELEFFGNGADMFIENIKVTGSSALSIIGRRGYGGPDNYGHACGAIGSVKLTLKVTSITADKTATLEVGGSRIPIRLHARRATGLRWAGMSPANYNSGSSYGNNCVRASNGRLTGDIGGLAGLSVLEGNTLRITLSPDDLAALNACPTPPAHLWVNFNWDREAGVGEKLYETGPYDPITAVVTRKSSEGSSTLTTRISEPSTGAYGHVEFRMSELNTFIGTASYDVSLAPAVNSPPIRVIIDTVPANGVKTLGFSVPVATSPLRNVSVSYTLQAPARAGQTLKWTTYARNPGTGAATRIQNNCFTQAEGTVPLQAGARSGTVVLTLSDAPGCSNLMAQVQLRAIGATPEPTDFNFTPLSSASGEFDLPDHVITTQLANPPKPTLTPVVPLQPAK